MADTVFDIIAIRDDTARMWVGICNDLPLATEAETLESLYARVLAIGPEIAALNGHENARFRIVTEPVPLIAAE